MKTRLYHLGFVIMLAFSIEGLLMATLSASAAQGTTTSTTTWIDHFANIPLDSRWSWVREDAANWSLTTQPGFLHILLQQGLINDSTNKNMLVQKAPVGDFEIQTRLIFNPTENIQRAGLLIYQDDINYIFLMRAYCGYVVTCVGDGIYFDLVEQDQVIGNNFAMATTVTDVYLGLIRNNSDYSAYISTNGVDWTFVGTHTVNSGFVPSKIGLMVEDANFGAAGIPADFDYFLLADDTYYLNVPIILN